MEKKINQGLLAFALIAALVGCQRSSSDGDPDRLSYEATQERLKTNAKDTSLLGFRLGQPLALPACEGEPLTRESACMVDESTVFVPQPRRPAYLDGEVVKVRRGERGRLEQVSVTVVLFDIVASDLAMKHGRPDFASHVFPPSDPTWNFANFEVVADRVTGEDRGEIVARTAAERARVKAELDAEEARQRQI